MVPLKLQQRAHLATVASLVTGYNHMAGRRMRSRKIEGVLRSTSPVHWGRSRRNTQFSFGTGRPFREWKRITWSWPRCIDVSERRAHMAMRQGAQELLELRPCKLHHLVSHSIHRLLVRGLQCLEDRGIGSLRPVCVGRGPAAPDKSHNNS